jgi:phenylalanine-4-hydroxylase
LITHLPSSTTIKAKKQTPERAALENYTKPFVHKRNEDLKTSLVPIFNKLKAEHPNDWLLTVEITELLKRQKRSSTTGRSEGLS